MNRLIVEYDADKGQAFSDNKSKEYVGDVVKTHVNAHVVIGTEFLLTLFRCAIVEGKIKHDEITFLFKGERVKVDKYGAFASRWPKGFSDCHMLLLKRIILSRAKLKNKEDLKS